jgi:hypothetical protein
MKKSIKSNFILIFILTIVFTISHLFLVFMLGALASSWGDVGTIGYILKLGLFILVPFLIGGEYFSFFGYWIYFISAVVWAVFLSLICTKVFRRKGEASGTTVNKQKTT